MEDGLFWYGLDPEHLDQSGLSLLGPPASEMFADLAPADLNDLLVTSLHWWMALPTPSDDHPAPGAEDAVLGAWPRAGQAPVAAVACQGRRRPAAARGRLPAGRPYRGIDPLLAPRRRRAVDARGCSSSKSWRRSQVRAADRCRRTRSPGRDLPM